MLRVLVLLGLFLAHSICWAVSDVTQSGEPRALLELGNQTFNEGRYAESLDLYTKGLELADQAGDITNYTAALGSIGNLYCLIKNYDRGAYYYFKGYMAAIEQKDERLQSMFLINMVMSYSYAGKDKECLECCEKLQKLPTWDSELNLYYRSVIEGCAATAKSDYGKAIEYNREALSIALTQNLGLSYEMAQHEALGLTYEKMGRLDSALVHFDYIMQNTQGNEYTELITSIYKDLADVYLQLGDTTLSRQYNERNALLRDSLFYGPEMDAAMNRLFAYEKRANDNQVMSLHKTIDMQKVMLFIFLGLLLVLAVLTYIIFGKNRSLNTAYQVLVEKNKEQLLQEKHNRQLHEAASNEKEEDLVDKEEKNLADKEGEEEVKLVMNREQADKLLQDIESVMLETRYISSPDFNLATLAKLVESNTKYVSWVINDTYNKNFKTYLNEYRVREASRRLSDPEYNNYTISAIAEMVGFNSPTTFIQAFKKVVGMTPSVYQRLANKGKKEE